MQLDEGAEDLLSGIVAKEVCIMHVYSLYVFLLEKLKLDEFEDAPQEAKEKLTVTITFFLLIGTGDSEEAIEESSRQN